MFKKFLKLFFILILIIIFFISYLSFFGLKTNKFNNFIYTNFEKKFSGISIEISDVYLRLQPLNFSLLLDTQNPIIKYENKNIKLEKLRAQILLSSLISDKIKFNKINILSKKNNINEFINLIRLFKNNFQITLLNKLIKSGEIDFVADFSLDSKGNLNQDYSIRSNIYNLTVEIPDKKFVNSDFELIIKKNIFNIKNANINYKNLLLKSDNIEIKKIKKHAYKLSGNIKNDFSTFDLDEIYKMINFNNTSIVNDDIKFSSENKFSFEISNKLKISNFNSESFIKIDSIKYRNKNSKLAKILNIDEYLEFVDQNIKIKFYGNPLKNISRNKLYVEGYGNFLNGSRLDKFEYKFIKENEKDNLKGKFFIKNNSLSIHLIDFVKPEDEELILQFELHNKNKSSFILKNFSINNLNNSITGKDLIFSNQLELQSIDELNINFVNNKNVRNNLKIKKLNKKYQISGEQFDASEIINQLMDSDNNQGVLKNFDEKVQIDVKQLFFDEDLYVDDLEGFIEFKDSKIYNMDLNSKFPNKEKLSLRIDTKNGNQFTKMTTNYPEPLIKRYKFIKGFKEGILNYQSSKAGNQSKSLLIIDNFKVQEVPVLAKILTLASLQGIADLLTGEGIRFTDFEMKYQKNKNLTEINEIYAIGPAISLMMSGYIEKDKIVSLKGTLVPATTINRTIASIPVLGDILVGKKVGEGVFGVSFKIKGHPDNLKTTVNPIKTLTPRFITRTLEKIKN